MSGRDGQPRPTGNARTPPARPTATRSNPPRTNGTRSSGGRKPPKPRPSWLLQRLRAYRFSPARLALTLTAITLYTLVLSVSFPNAGLTWKVGDIAGSTVYAPRYAEYVDEEATADLRNKAMQAVPKQYQAADVRGQAAAVINRFFDDVAARSRTGAAEAPPVAERVAQVRASTRLALSPELIRHALAMPDNRRQWLREVALTVINGVYAGYEIRDDEPDTLVAARNEAAQRVRSRDLPADDQALVEALVTDPLVLRPNRIHDEEATIAQSQAAADAVEPVRRTIARGERVLLRGDRVSEEHLRDFQELGLIQPERNYFELIALSFLVTLVLITLGVYMRSEQTHLYDDLPRLALLNLLAIGALVAFRLLLGLKVPLPSLSHPAVFCSATVGMVVAALLDYRLSMMMTGALALMMGLLMPGASLWVAFEAWFAGRVGAMVIHHVRERTDLFHAGATMALAGALIAIVVQLPLTSSTATYGPAELAEDAGFGAFWGLLAFILAQFLVPVLERPFGVVTAFRLLELTNTSSPLLQRLRRDARGTFDASLTIGEMAADACEAVDADPLLARAAGYHHDIGKLEHPSWFIENQFGGDNIHDSLKPTVSATAIKSHVADGVKLAKDYGLPQPLIDVIQQHHGTELVSFFYEQALQQSPDGIKVDREHFRYDGPKPQFRESGIIMLADGIEAAVRAASSHGPLSEKKIQDVVRGIIDARMSTGQLDECDLTLRDLQVIADTFVEHLRGMYHNRIDYPPEVMARKRNGQTAARHP